MKKIARKASPEFLSLPCGRPLPQSAGSHAEPAEPLLRHLSQKLEQYVISQGLKRSDVRLKILEVIVREARHFRAVDLLPVLQRRHPDVGRATVYRNLPVLAASGILQEGPHDSEGQVYFELADDRHHDHIVCLDCHEIFEFHDDQIERRQRQVTDKMDFVAEAHRHVIYARCHRLKRKS